MTEPWFIGEAPSRSTSRPGGAPLVGESGLRLATWAGLSPAEFRARAHLVNLFDRLPSRWRQTDAREQAVHLGNCLRRHDLAPVVVLLGRRVADAFEHRQGPWVPDEVRGVTYVHMPHPSGLNHYWNDPAHVAQAQRFLRALFGIKPGPEQPTMEWRT